MSGKNTDTEAHDDFGQRLDDYWRALGRFTHEFSQVEKTLQMTAMLTAMIPHDVARVAFGKLRVENSMEAIRSLRRSKNLPEHPALARAFPQLKLIARTRNDIVHHGADLSDAGFKVTNAIMALPGNEREIPVSPEILADLTADLRTIQHSLIIPSIENLPMPDDMKDDWRRSAGRPWRYSDPEAGKGR